MFRLKRRYQVAVAAFFVAMAGSAAASPMVLIDPNLPGNTQVDAWTNARLSTLESAGFGSFPGFAAWPAPGFIASSTPNVGIDGDAGLYKVANGPGGGPFASGASIYHGGTSSAANVLGGTLAVRDATPLTDVKNVVFQIQIGEATGYDFFNDVLPVLNYNGGSQQLASDTTQILEQYNSGVFQTPEGEEIIWTNTYLLQWDVSALGPITALEVAFSGVQHSQVYQLRLDQSDVFVKVPEPASVTLAGLALLGMVGLAWKRRGRK